MSSGPCSLQTNVFAENSVTCFFAKLCGQPPLKVSNPGSSARWRHNQVTALLTRGGKHRCGGIGQSQPSASKALMQSDTPEIPIDANHSAARLAVSAWRRGKSRVHSASPRSLAHRAHACTKKVLPRCAPSLGQVAHQPVCLGGGAHHHGSGPNLNRGPAGRDGDRNHKPWISTRTKFVEERGPKELTHPVL